MDKLRAEKKASEEKRTAMFELMKVSPIVKGTSSFPYNATRGYPPSLVILQGNTLLPCFFLDALVLPRRCTRPPAAADRALPPLYVWLTASCCAEPGQ